MGGNIQKGKQNNPNDLKNKDQLISVTDNDFKQLANLGNYRWFYCTEFQNWGYYNSLTKEEKKNVYWNIFPLEKSNEIERSYINKFPYENENKLIFFDFLEQKHMYIANENNSMVYLGIVKREKPSNIKYMKNTVRFDTNNLLNYFDNELNFYQYNLLNNLTIINYETIFSFFPSNSTDKIICKFLSTNILCNRKLNLFLTNEYQEYIKTNFVKYKTVPFSLEIMKNILLFDFKKETVFINYYINNLNEKNFDKIMISMFLEASEFNKQIIDFPTKCSRKNINYTTYYLCLLYILMNMNKYRDDWEKNSIGGKSYIYIPKNENRLKKNFYEYNYYFSSSLLITSKNKFNNIALSDKNINENYNEIEIRIPQKYSEINYHPLFNNSEFDIGDFSLYKEQNIIFPSNSVFKCLNVDKNNNKIILEFAYYSCWNPLLYLSKENKKRYNIIEEGFKYLTDDQRNQVFFARVKNKETKFIGGLLNLRELEIFDDNEPKTDVKTMVTYFNGFKKLVCLTIVGNNMVNKDCAKLSEGLKYLKELKILNLSFNSLTDSNISKINFDKNNKIEVLNLKSNTITDVGIDMFKDELLKLKNLKELNLYDNQFGDGGFKILLSILKTLKNLRILTVPNCGIGQLGIKYFSEYFKNTDDENNNKISTKPETETESNDTANTPNKDKKEENNKIKENNNNTNNNNNGRFLENLECLNLITNPFGDECEENLITILTNLKSLKKYNLGQTQMTPYSKHKIFLIMHKKNKNWYFDEKGGWYKISTINLKEDFLFSKIAKQNEIPLKFHKLNLKWLKKNANKYKNKLYFDFSESNLNDNDISILNQGLLFYPNIKGLNFSFSPRITPKAYIGFAECLKKLTNLSEISFSSNSINDEGLKNLCKFLDKNSKINTINLSWNDITTDGFSALCKTINNNKLRIKDLDLCGNKINDEGFKIFSEEVKIGTFNFLYKINFSNNLLGDETMFIFFTIFNAFPNLAEINFSNNNITDNSIINFSSVINDLIDNIEVINISNNKLSNALKCFFGEIGIPFNIIY